MELKRVDHVGIAVKNLDESVRLWNSNVLTMWASP